MKKVIAVTAVLIVLIGAIALIMGLSDKNKDDIGTSAPQSHETSTFRGLDGIEDGERKPSTENNAPQQDGEKATEAPVSCLPEDKDDLLALVTDAVNKTKAYKGSMTVDHVQSYDVSITDVPGGSAVKSVANGIAEGIAKPIDETLEFSNAAAKGSDGDKITMLLPQDAPFSLPAQGVKSVQAGVVNGNTVVTICLNEEKGTMDNPSPPCHAESVGCINLGELNFGPVKMTQFDVTYYATTMVFTINQDGYVIKAVYDIPFKLDLEGELLGYSADIKIEGKQYETWTIK